MVAGRRQQVRGDGERGVTVNAQRRRQRAWGGGERGATTSTG